MSWRIELRPHRLYQDRPWIVVPQAGERTGMCYRTRTQAGAQAKMRGLEWDEHCRRWAAERAVRQS